MANEYDPYDYLAGPKSPTQRRRAAVARLMQQLPNRNIVRDEMRAKNPLTATAIDLFLGGGASGAALKAMRAIGGLLPSTPFAARPFASNVPVSGPSIPIEAARLTSAGATPAQRAVLAAITAGVAGTPRPTPPVDAIPPASQPDFYQLPRTPAASQPDFYQLPRRPATTSSKVAVAPTKAQQKIIDDAAKNYQSNSMPVLIQPQGPMKGGATMQPSINWGTDATGYGSEDNFGGSAADLLRADELRRKMPGLLGWGGE